MNQQAVKDVVVGQGIVADDGRHRVGGVIDEGVSLVVVDRAVEQRTRADGDGEGHQGKQDVEVGAPNPGRRDGPQQEGGIGPQPNGIPTQP